MVCTGARGCLRAHRPLAGCDALEALYAVSSRRRLPPLLWAALIIILTSLPGSHIPALPFRNFDKIVHLTIYGVLGWLTTTAWVNGSRATAATLVTLAVVSCFGAIDEWHQQFISQRSMDLLDWAADTMGAAVGIAMALASGRRRVSA